MDVNTVLAKVGKRRLLALDGGRIRGMMSLQILKRIEKIVLEKELPGVTTLGDYFDYIAGTSTGAIIAACLARGMSVAEIEQFYKRCGPDMFVRANLLKRLSFTNKYESEPLAKKLREVLDENTTLDDPTLKCLLMMVLRNATTDSPWPLSNNPQAKYNNQGRDDCNLGLPLWQVVRASTAAPYFFPPESIEHGSTPFVFVDGGVTMYNNPAFQLFLMATLEPYRLQWKASEDDMLLVSVGTGSAAAVSDKTANQMWLADHLGVAGALMYAAAREQDLLYRAFGNCLAGPELDREVGSLHSCKPIGEAAKKLFTYVRYDADLSPMGLASLHVDQCKSKDVQQMDSIEFLDDLAEVGAKAAVKVVDAKHFANF